jgi:hypothetical protein
MDNEKVIINGTVYVPESKMKAEELDGMKYCIVRTYSAGVFAGYIESREGQEVIIKQARRLWYWDGAASLSQLAMSGTSKPENCKFPEIMDRVTVTQAIEIIECSLDAKKSIEAVQIWKA